MKWEDLTSPEFDEAIEKSEDLMNRLFSSKGSTNAEDSFLNKKSPKSFMINISKNAASA